MNNMNMFNEWVKPTDAKPLKIGESVKIFMFDRPPLVGTIESVGPGIMDVRVTKYEHWGSSVGDLLKFSSTTKSTLVLREKTKD